MEAEKREIVEKKIYEDGEKEYASKGLAGTALGFGIGGAVLGAASLWGRGRSIGFGGGMPENININTVSDAISGRTGVAPTAFQAWEKSCDEALALTNTIWGLKVNTLNEMYAHRDTDVSEKFGLYKSQIDGDFGNYKVSRDLYDNMNDKFVNASFGLYKGQRDLYDVFSEKFNALDKKVAVLEATKPYEHRLIQCEIDKAFRESIWHTDRRTCRMISGEVVLPNTPTVTGYASYNPCGVRHGSTVTAEA